MKINFFRAFVIFASCCKLPLHEDEFIQRFKRIHVEFFFFFPRNESSDKRFPWIVSSKRAFPFLSWIKKLQRGARLDSLPLHFMRLIMSLTEHCLWLSRSKLSIEHILEALYLSELFASKIFVLLSWYTIILHMADVKFYIVLQPVINYSLSKVRVVSFITKIFNLSNRAIILS